MLKNKLNKLICNIFGHKWYQVSYKTNEMRCARCGKEWTRKSLR